MSDAAHKRKRLEGNEVVDINNDVAPSQPAAVDLSSLKLPHSTIQHLRSEGDITTPQLLDALCAWLPKDDALRDVAPLFAASPQLRYCMGRVPPKNFECLHAHRRGVPSGAGVRKRALSFPMLLGEEIYNFDTHTVALNYRVFWVATMDGSQQNMEARHLRAIKEAALSYEAPVNVIASCSHFVVMRLPVAEATDEGWVLSLRNARTWTPSFGAKEWAHRLMLGTLGLKDIRTKSGAFSECSMSAVSFAEPWRAVEVLPPRFCSMMPRLQHIDFSNLQGLRSFGPASFSYCAQLTRLDFRPLKALEHLGKVAPSCHKLRTVLFGSLPKLNTITGSFTDCPQLRRIDFSQLQGLQQFGRFCADLLQPAGIV